MHPSIQETELISWQQRVEQGKNVFPLLRAIMAKDRTSLIYQEVKKAFLKNTPRGKKKRQKASQKHWNHQHTVGVSQDTSIKAEGRGRQQNIDGVDDGTHGVEEQKTLGVGELNTDGVIAEGVSAAENIWEESREASSSTEELTDILTEDKLKSQDEIRMKDIESLNEELDSLISNRNDIRGQLDRLQTDCWTLVGWQNSVDYLMRYPEVLSVFNVELPGMDSVSSPQNQNEGNLPSGTAHRENTVFKRDSKLKLSDVTYKLVEVKREDGYTAEDGCQVTSRYTGLIHQLRKYQHGSLKEINLTSLTLKVMAEDEQQLAQLVAKNDSLEKGFGSTVHIVGLECRPLSISCPRLHLDASQANSTWCHVTEDGHLINRPPDTPDEGRNRLQRYPGTCSSPIHIPPSSSTLTTLPTSYWETETRVRVVGSVLSGLLEMGVCEAGQVDRWWSFSVHRRSWCVIVGRCGRHGESFCTRVWREGKEGECHQNTMSLTPGTQATLHYGVVLDVRRGRVVFIDIDKQVVLDKFNVEFTEALVPIFCVGWSHSGCTTSMSLISEEDIDMSDTKKSLIYQALK